MQKQNVLMMAWKVLDLLVRSKIIGKLELHTLSRTESKMRMVSNSVGRVQIEL